MGSVLFVIGVPSAQSQAYCGLQYKVGSVGAVFPGGSFTFFNNFTNTGSVQLNVVSITLTTDIGTFSPPSGLPLQVAAGATKELDMTVQVPSSASVGAHPASASASFQCFDPSTSQYVIPSFSPLVIQTTLTVSQNPSTAGLIGSIVLGVIVALVVAVVLLVVRLRRKRGMEAMPPTPAQPPPPSIPPGPG